MKPVRLPVSTPKESLDLISTALQGFWGDRIPAETARRVRDYWREFTPPDYPVSDLIKAFDCDADQVVLVQDIPYQSLCEHHLLPFFGMVSIAYIPQGKVMGLSKFGRVTDYYAKRPQLQEQMTQQIGQAIDKYLHPLGVMVIATGTHTCMSARGVLKQGAITKTSFVSGAFEQDLNARQEVLSLVTA